MMRFINKYRKWKGCDWETAQEKWNEFVRDANIKRCTDTDGSLLLAAPVTGTTFDIHGSRVGDKRSIMEVRRVDAGDTDAILDERNRFLA